MASHENRNRDHSWNHIPERIKPIGRSSPQTGKEHSRRSPKRYPPKFKFHSNVRLSFGAHIVEFAANNAWLPNSGTWFYRVKEHDEWKEAILSAGAAILPLKKTIVIHYLDTPSFIEEAHCVGTKDPDRED